MTVGLVSLMWFRINYGHVCESMSRGLTQENHQPSKWMAPYNLQLRYKRDQEESSVRACPPYFFLSKCVSPAALLCWHHTLVSSAFQHGLNTSHSLGNVRTFTVWLRLEGAEKHQPQGLASYQIFCLSRWLLSPSPPLSSKLLLEHTPFTGFLPLENHA